MARRYWPGKLSYIHVIENETAIVAEYLMTLEYIWHVLLSGQPGCNIQAT